MTINSFSAVSLSPSLVQWSLKKDSFTHSLFSDLPVYSISVLSRRQLEVSKRYALAGDHILCADDYLKSPGGIPYIRESLAHFECRSRETHEVGDHSIIVAVVENFAADVREEPLVFYGGSYASLVLGA
jgi:flavin reductase (DIM6/NTAB) family NADH-FMN oxidoreductase RutF